MLKNIPIHLMFEIFFHRFDVGFALKCLFLQGILHVVKSVFEGVGCIRGGK